MQIGLPVIAEGSKTRISRDPVRQMKFRQYSQMTALCSSLGDKFHSPGEVVFGFEGLEEERIRDDTARFEKHNVALFFGSWLCFTLSVFTD